MGKRLIVFIVLNMLVILAAVGIGMYACTSAGRYYSRDVIYVAPRIDESRLYFSEAEINRLARDNPGFVFSAISKGSIRVVANTQAVVTPVILTDTYYFSMHAMNFIEGSHWQSDLNVNTIVINQALAWRLFGTTRDVVGHIIQVNQRQYIVVGVVRQAQAGTYLAWMPRDNSDLPISALYVRPHTARFLAASIVTDMIGIGLHRHTGDYTIVCINRYVESFGIRYRLLLGLIWMYVLLLLFRVTCKNLRRIPAAIKDGNPAGVIYNIVLPVIWGAICVFLLLGANNILNWLPNLSDPNTSVFESISSIGLLPLGGHLPYGLLSLSRLSRHANYAFIAGLVGVVNLLFCLRLPDLGLRS